MSPHVLSRQQRTETHIAKTTEVAYTPDILAIA
jgi:hypothetical protein